MSFFLLALIAAVIAQVLGWAWFGPIFGKKWCWVVDMIHPDSGKPKMMDYPMWIPMAINFVMSYLTAFTLYFLFGILGVPNFMAILLVVAIIFVGFILPVEVGNVIWSGKSVKKQWIMFGLTAGFQVINFIIMALIFNFLA